MTAHARDVFAEGIEKAGGNSIFRIIGKLKIYSMTIQFNINIISLNLLTADY